MIRKFLIKGTTKQYQIDLDDEKMQIIIGAQGFGLIESIVQGIKDNNLDIRIYNAIIDYHPVDEEEALSLAEIFELNIRNRELDVHALEMQYVLSTYKFILENKNKACCIIYPETAMNINYQEDFINTLKRHCIYKIWIYTNSPDIVRAHEGVVDAKSVD